MKVICSLNGIDGTGKTTQIEMLNQKYNNIIDSFSGLEKYKGFPKLSGQKLHNWWFNESSIQEFCDAIYESLNNRNKEIEKSKKNIIIIDKGILNFDARVKASLEIRGFDEKEIEKNIEKSKIKYKFKDIENLKILIYKETKSLEKIRDNNYERNQMDLYQRYQKAQINNIESAKEQFDVIIDYNKGIDKINNEIQKSIIKQYLNEMSKENYYINISKSLKYISNSMKYIDVKQNYTDEFVGITESIKLIYNKHWKNSQIYNVNMNIHTKRNKDEYKQILLDKATHLKRLNKKIKTKKIEEYKVPEFYKNILSCFIKELRSKVENLNLILIHGSVGRECIHNNWSDIDIIICINEYKFDTLDIISDLIKKYNKIKIGTTIYSKLEIESLNVDAKTLYALYLMQNDYILPVFIKDIDIIEISKEDLISKNLAVLPESIHKLKRLLYKNSEIDRQSIIKTLNLIMKAILINNNIFLRSYEEIFSTFAELYKIEKIDIAKYLNKEKMNEEELLSFAKKVIEIIIN